MIVEYPQIREEICLCFRKMKVFGQRSHRTTEPRAGSFLSVPRGSNLVRIATASLPDECKGKLLMVMSSSVRPVPHGQRGKGAPLEHPAILCEMVSLLGETQLRPRQGSSGGKTPHQQTLSVLISWSIKEIFSGSQNIKVVELSDTSVFLTRNKN